jgi:hypothetical protein
MKRKLPENSSLKVRLAAYTSAAGALMILASDISGQVIYFGPQNLESFLPDGYLEIDLDTNGVNDFGFLAYGFSSFNSSGPYFSKITLGVGAIDNPKTDSYNNSWIAKMSTLLSSATYYGGTHVLYTAIPDGLASGEIVDSLRNSWSDASGLATAGIMGGYRVLSYNGYNGSGISSISFGDFLGEEKYIGVKFYIGSEPHYGWIRVSLGNRVDPLTVVDWAYESTSNKRILAGDGLGIDLPPNLLITGGGIYSADSTQTLTIHAGEEVTGLEIGDILVTNGTAGNLTELTPGLDYSVDIKAENEGKVTVEIPAGAVMDMTGNENPSASASWYLDRTPPQVSFADYGNPVNSMYTSLIVNSDEKIQGLTIFDFIVTNGSVDYLDTNSVGRSYYLVILANEEGDISVQLPQGSVHDLAGNVNEAAAASWVYDATPPEITLTVDNSTITNAETEVDVNSSEVVQSFEAGFFMVTNGTATQMEPAGDNLHWTLNVIAAAAGIVTVELPAYMVYDLASNGNASAVVAWLYEPVGINTPTEEGISLYPNPATGTLQVELPSEASVQLLDMHGNVVFNRDKMLKEAIDISGFTPGAYIVSIRTNNSVYRYKIIIE